MENNLTQVVALGTSIGRSQAFGAITYKCSVEQAKAFEQVWESGGYKLLGLTWEKYCLVYAGLSHQRVEGIIRNRQEFGDIYLRLSDIIAISPETYRHIQPQVHQDCLEISGEMVPILPENAARIREAVSRLRTDLRKAQDDVRPRSPGDTLASTEIARLQTRFDAWLGDLRRMAPRLAASQDDASLRGLVQYSIQHLQEVARGFPQ
jgi:hypothetical protein